MMLLFILILFSSVRVIFCSKYLNYTLQLVMYLSLFSHTKCLGITLLGNLMYNYSPLMPLSLSSYESTLFPAAWYFSRSISCSLLEMWKKQKGEFDVLLSAISKHPVLIIHLITHNLANALYIRITQMFILT